MTMTRPLHLRGAGGRRRRCKRRPTGGMGRSPERPRSGRTPGMFLVPGGRAFQREAERVERALSTLPHRTPHYASTVGSGYIRRRYGRSTAEIGGSG